MRWMLGIALLLVSGVLHAGEPGRYRAIALHEGGAIGQTGALKPKVLILDTQDGHLWTWSENELLQSGPDARAYGSAIVYQGRVRPAQKMGEVVDQQSQ